MSCWLRQSRPNGQAKPLPRRGRAEKFDTPPRHSAVCDLESTARAGSRRRCWLRWRGEPALRRRAVMRPDRTRFYACGSWRTVARREPGQLGLGSPVSLNRLYFGGAVRLPGVDVLPFASDQPFRASDFSYAPPGAPRHVSPGVLVRTFGRGPFEKVLWMPH